MPSESNAADWPSRGLAYKQQKARQRRRVQQGHSGRLGRVRQYSKLERALTRHSNQVKFVKNWIRDHGLAISSASSSGGSPHSGAQ